MHRCSGKILIVLVNSKEPPLLQPEEDVGVAVEEVLVPREAVELVLVCGYPIFFTNFFS
jgi:hypothetical protein